MFSNRRNDSRPGLLLLTDGGLSSGHCRLEAQDLAGFGMEAPQLLVVRLLFLHPRDGPIVPPTGLFPVAELPAGHSYEEPIEAVGSPAQLRGFLQGGRGGV